MTELLLFLFSTQIYPSFYFLTPPLHQYQLYSPKFNSFNILSIHKSIIYPSYHHLPILPPSPHPTTDTNHKNRTQTSRSIAPGASVEPATICLVLCEEMATASHKQKIRFWTEPPQNCEAESIKTDFLCDEAVHFRGLHKQMLTDNRSPKPTSGKSEFSISSLFS